MDDIEQHKIDVNKIKEYWTKEAAESLKVAQHLYEKADHS